MLMAWLLVAMLADLDAQEAKSFSVTARQFTFDVTPAAFAVNQGDAVTITLTAADDGVAGSGHGFGMEQYVQSPAEIHPGQTVTIEFVADVPGTFTYFCTRVCGDGHVVMTGTFTVNAVASEPPVIASIDPRGGPAEGGTEVAIEGARFQPGAAVAFGGTPATGVLVASATRIVATSPPHEPGDVPVTVTNRGGQSATAAQLFTYESPSLGITGVTPSRGTTAGGTNLRIDGNAFAAGAAVTIGGVPARNVSVPNPSVILATTPAGPHDIAGPSARAVAVTNPDGATATLTAAFTWELPSPSIASVVPASGPAGTVVTIRGAGFSTATAMEVRFGGVPATSVRVVDAVTLTAVAPPRAAGRVDVTVAAANGTATAAGAFTYASTARRRAIRH